MSATQAATPDGPTPLERLRYYRSEISFEFSQLHNRTNAYLTSRTFLVAAYTVAMVAQNELWYRVFSFILTVIVCQLGKKLSSLARPGVDGACEIINLYHSKQWDLFEEHGERKPLSDNRDLTDIDGVKPGKRDHIHEQSLTFSRKTPQLFLCAWTQMLTLSVVMHILIFSYWLYESWKRLHT